MKNGDKALAKAERRTLWMFAITFFAFIGSIVYGALLYINLMPERVKQLVRDDPDQIPALHDFYQGYGCSNHAGFEQMLEDHSHYVTRRVFENGILQDKTSLWMDAYAIDAFNHHEELCNAISNSPSDYLIWNYTEWGLIIGIPLICIMFYLIFRHRYKKLLRSYNGNRA